MRPLAMVSAITEGSPPQSQSPSARFGKPLLPRASEPWHWAQLFMNRRSPIAWACVSLAISGTGIAAYFA